MCYIHLVCVCLVCVFTDHSVLAIIVCVIVFVCVFSVVFGVMREFVLEVEEALALQPE